MTKHQPQLSKCHNAPVTIGGTGDFDDKDAVITQYYVCSECGQPCDLQHQPDRIEEILQDLYEYSYMQAVHDERDDGLQMSSPMTVPKALTALNSYILELLAKQDLESRKDELRKAADQVLEPKPFYFTERLKALSDKHSSKEDV